jgi:hypothetical protein
MIDDSGKNISNDLVDGGPLPFLFGVFQHRKGMPVEEVHYPSSPLSPPQQGEKLQKLYLIERRLPFHLGSR